MYIYVDSRNRDVTQYPDPNSYCLYLTSAIPEINKITLISANIPNTIYNISEGTNMLSLYNGTTNTTTSYSIPNGFYSPEELATAITNSTNGFLTVQYIHSQSKFLFYASFQFTFELLSQNSYILGLRPDFVYTSSYGAYTTDYANDPVLSVLYLVISEFSAQITSVTTVMLDIEEFRNTGSIVDSQSLTTTVPVTSTLNDGTVVQTSTQTPSRGLKTERVVGIIPMDVPYGDIKYFKENTDFIINVHLPNPLRNVRKLTIQWIDEYGNLVNFNSLEHTFILEVDEN
jgi:hypothetical protein